MNNERIKMKNTSKKHLSLLIPHFSLLLAFALANPITANAGFDESKPFNGEDVSEQYLKDNNNHDFNYYIENSENWQFGEEFESNDETKKAATLANKYKYNKLTGEIGEVTDDYNIGDVVFTTGGSNNPANGFDNSDYICTVVNSGEVGSYVSTGMHIYSYTSEPGSVIPIKKWVNFGRFFADHNEDISVWENNEATLIPNEGRWAKWSGIEFHSSRTDIPMQLAYEIASPCRNENWNGESMIDYWNFNNVAWVPVCSICDEYIMFMYHYCPKVGIIDIPVLEQGAQVTLTCPHCGGLENTCSVNHSCVGLSSNLLKVAYSKNADDAFGYMSDSRFLYHGGNEYEGKEIVVDSYVKDNKFSRTGYTFKGWATSPSGPVKYAPGTPLSMLKSEYATPTNGATITLYAIWEAKKGTLSVTHANIAKGGAKYQDNEKGTMKNDGNWISNTISYPNGITLDGTITPPVGYTATFDAYTNQLPNCKQCNRL